MTGFITVINLGNNFQIEEVEKLLNELAEKFKIIKISIEVDNK